MHSIDGVNENIPYNNAVLYVLMYTQMYPFTPSILGIGGVIFFYFFVLHSYVQKG